MGRRRSLGLTLVELTVITSLTLIAMMILARQIRLEMKEVGQARKQAARVHRWMDPMSRLRSDLKSAVDLRISRNRIELVHMALTPPNPPEAELTIYQVYTDTCGDPKRKCFTLGIQSNAKTEYYRNFQKIHWCLKSKGNCPKLPTPITQGELFIAQWEVIMDQKEIWSIPMAVLIRFPMQPNSSEPIALSQLEVPNAN